MINALRITGIMSEIFLSTTEYWNQRYASGETGWDAGTITTPLKEYIDQLGTDLSILIPGCGNAYEAAYLAEKGYRNITLIDISSVLTRKISKELPSSVKIITGDFFQHCGSYDLILEQTFFCAFDPRKRKDYVSQVTNLLHAGGKLAGVLFCREFESSPPFGGNMNEYKELFKNALHIRTMEPCYNSIKPRKGTELFVIMEKTVS